MNVLYPLEQKVANLESTLLKFESSLVDTLANQISEKWSQSLGYYLPSLDKLNSEFVSYQELMNERLDNT